MTDAEKREIVAITAELRHLYENVWNMYVKKHRELADGLLSPQIKRLEKMVQR